MSSSSTEWIRLDKFEQFKARCRTSYFTEEHVLLAIKYGRINFLNWMVEEIAKNSFKGNARVLRPNPFSNICVHLLDYAIMHSNLESVKWLTVNRPREECTSKSAFFLCKYQNIDLLEWVTENRKEFQLENPNHIEFDISCIIAACSSGNLNVLKWIEEKRPEFYKYVPLQRKSIMLTALINEKLEVAQWLHDNVACFHMPLDQEIFDIVARNPNPDALIWLAHSRPEYKNTILAINTAVKFDRFLNLQWLCSNREEFKVENNIPTHQKTYIKCSKETLFLAMQSTRCFNYLLRTRPEFNPSSSFGNMSSLTLECIHSIFEKSPLSDKDKSLIVNLIFKDE